MDKSKVTSPAEFNYDEQLVGAAKNFLMEVMSTPGMLEGETIVNVLDAAMRIVTGKDWLQPSVNMMRFLEEEEEED